MRRALLAPAAALAAALLRAPPAPAQDIRPVPEALRGAWFSGSCEAPDAVLAVAARSVARVPAQGPARLDRFVEARELSGWLLGTSRGPEAPRLMLREREGALDTAEPDNKTRDDRLPGEVPVTAWRRCDPAPARWMLPHGEGIALLGVLEVLEAACGRGAPVRGCVRAVLAEADVSGDGLLSPAEIARILRGLSWLLAIQESATERANALALGVGSLGGLAAARLLVDSLDYDGDGRLSEAELLRDRVAAPPAGEAAGRPLRLEGFGEALIFLQGLAEGVLGPR